MLHCTSLQSCHAYHELYRDAKRRTAGEPVSLQRACSAASPASQTSQAASASASVVSSELRHQGRGNAGPFAMVRAGRGSGACRQPSHQSCMLLFSTSGYLCS